MVTNSQLLEGYYSMLVPGSIAKSETNSTVELTRGNLYFLGLKEKNATHPLPAVFLLF